MVVTLDDGIVSRGFVREVQASDQAAALKPVECVVDRCVGHAWTPAPHNPENLGGRWMVVIGAEHLEDCLPVTREATFGFHDDPFRIGLDTPQVRYNVES